MSAFNIVSYTICGTVNDGNAVDGMRNQCCARPISDRRGDGNTAFVVCDGMGGPGKGDVAANVVCDVLYDNLKRHATVPNDEAVYCTVENAYDAMDSLPVDESGRMGTTMAMLSLSAGNAMMAHLGNCRVYHIRPGLDADSTSIMYVSTDHTLANYMVRRGTITADQAIRQGKHKVLTRAMQQRMDQRCMPDIYRTADICDGDYFLLITSDMVSRIDDYGIRSVFSREGGNDRSKVNQLVLLALDCPDNHAAIIVRVHRMDAERQMQNTFSADSGDESEASRVAAIGHNNARRGARPANTTTKQQYKRKNRRMTNPAVVADLFKSNKRLIKLLFAIMAVLTLVMIIYYLFIHKDEQLRTAGTATESAVVTGLPGEETYGYETDASYVTAEPSLPAEAEESDEADETTADGYDVDAAPTTTPDGPAEVQQPAPKSDEPILQE